MDQSLRPPRTALGPWLAGLASLALLLPGLSPLAAERLALDYQALPLPGVPVSVLTPDLDRDGRRDLVVAVAYTEWDQTAVEERSEMDGIEGLVEVLTIVPSLEDRRELRVYLAGDEGYRMVGEPLELPPSVLALAEGVPGAPVIALTDDGVSVLELDSERGPGLRPVVAQPPILAGSGVFLPRLRLVADVVGDPTPDLLLPTDTGLAVHAGGALGFAEAETTRVAPPGEQREGRRRAIPWPEVADLTGDGRPDLLWQDPEDGWARPRVSIGHGSSFRPALEIPRPGSPAEEIVYVGNLDAEGRAELVTAEELTREDEDLGVREEIREAEAPPYRYRFYRLNGDLRPEATPYTTLHARGYAFLDGSELRLPGGFRDLHGDGRPALLTLTLELSITKALRALATKRMTLPMDFHLFCPQPDGGFRPVRDLDLSGKFKLNLNDIRLRTLPMFDGDFDGDGRVDFAQLGRGRKVTIHRGEGGCRFPTRPDLTVKLEEAPRLVELVEVRDLDGDGRADLLVIQPGSAAEAGVTAPVRLDLYLSGGGR